MSATFPVTRETECIMVVVASTMCVACPFAKRITTGGVVDEKLELIQ